MKNTRNKSFEKTPAGIICITLGFLMIGVLFAIGVLKQADQHIVERSAITHEVVSIKNSKGVEVDVDLKKVNYTENWVNHE